MPHTDRCANPMRISGEKGHYGKDLRKASKAIREKFPFLSSIAKICFECRRRATAYVVPSSHSLDDFETDNLPGTSRISESPHQSFLRSGHSFHATVSEDNSLTDTDTIENDSDDSNDATQSSSKRYRISPEALLEEMLDGIKEKFTASKSYSERLQLLTILPLSMSIREISEKFETTPHMVKMAKKLRNTKGVFASPIAKAGRKLSDETVTKVRLFYKENSRIMPGVKDKISIRVDGKKKSCKNACFWKI